MEPLIPKKINELQLFVNSYEPPRIELIEIVVEKGFADSVTDWGSDPWNPGT